jgi:predicted amidohydrolase YtcJ
VVGPFSNLRDAHLHLAEHGEALGLVNLSSCGSVEECLRLVAEAARGMDLGAWVRAKGARVTGWPEQRYPTAQELDEASGGRCAIVQSFDHHAMAVSTPVLERSQLTTHSAHQDRFIERDARGEPTGVLLESACKAVWDAMPGPTAEDKRQHVVAAQADLMRRGFVEAHDMFSTPAFARVVLELESRGELAMRVWLYATPEHLDGVQRVFDEAVVQGARESRGGMVKLAGLKLFADGTLNSRTAAMLAEYAEGGGKGHLFFTTEQLAKHIAGAAERGYQTGVHAIGDAAVRQVLDAYELAGRPTIPGRPALRIEHAEFVDAADVPRFAAMNVITSMQPCHLLADVEAIQRFMPHRAERAFALRELIDAARRAGRDERELLWLGSDAPVVDPSPEDNVAAATIRGRGDAIVVGAGQAVSKAECLALMRSIS